MIIRAFAATVLLLTLTACNGTRTGEPAAPATAVQNSDPTPTTVDNVDNSVSDTPLSGEEILSSCLRELRALRQLSPQAYEEKNREISRLVVDAKQYVNVRPDVNRDVNVIMDSAYQYHIAKTCNEVREQVTRILLNKIDTDN